MATDHQQLGSFPTKETPSSINQEHAADSLAAASQNTDAHQANSSLEAHKDPLTNGTNGTNGSSHAPQPLSSEVAMPTEQPILPPTMSENTTSAAEPVTAGELLPSAPGEGDPAQHEESDLRHEPVPEPLASVATSEPAASTDAIVSETAVPPVAEAPVPETISAPAEPSISALVETAPPIESGIAPEVNTTSDTIQSSAQDTSMQDISPVNASSHEANGTSDAMDIDAPAPTTVAQPPTLGIQTDLPSQPKHPRDEDETDGPASKRAKGEEESQSILPPSSGALVDTPTAIDSFSMPPPESSSRPSSRPVSRGRGGSRPGSRPGSRAQSKAGTPARGFAAAGQLQKNANGFYPVPDPRSNNPEWDQPMTTAQKKHLLRGIQNAKKGHHASLFALPVDPVLLNIPTYFDIVKEPMDLRTLDTNLKADHYPTVNAYLHDVDLIMTNSVKFNGPEHAVTQQGLLLHAAFERNLANLPNSTYVEPNASEKKAKKMAENPPKRRESRVLPSPTPGSARSPTNAQTFALKSDGVPLIRRDSSIQDGRPRREIHPPAPKDLPYSNTKPKRKKYVTELKFCAKVLEEMKKAKYSGINYAFLEPVDPVALNVPNYLKLIKKPMDMKTMGQKLERGEYENAKEFEDDFRLMLNNCFKFNGMEHPISIQGKELLGYFEAEWKKKQQWVKEHAPRSADISPESSEAEDVDEDEEEDEDEDEDDEEDNKAQAIANLSTEVARLQATIASLGGATKKTTPAADKKSKKKTAKATKEKSKKSGKPSKKDKPKRSSSNYPQITFQEKMTLSERINELPSDQMDQVMDIIRKGMPHLDFDSPDIELEIDELPGPLTNHLNFFVKEYHRSLTRTQPPKARSSIHQATVANANNKPKKNRPMKADEQVARIAEMEQRIAATRNGQIGGPTPSAPTQTMTPEEESSDDASEESEED